MPTSRPRLVVTESDELAAALDLAARRSPGRSRPALLVELALAGAARDSAVELESRELRRAAVRKWAGVFSDIWDPQALAELREDWPE